MGSAMLSGLLTAGLPEIMEWSTAANNIYRVPLPFGSVRNSTFSSLAPRLYAYPAKRLLNIIELDYCIIGVIPGE
jgi:hypothetical protein